MKEHPLPLKPHMMRATKLDIKTETRRVTTYTNSTVDGGALSSRKIWPYLDFDKAIVDPGFGDCSYLKVPHGTEGTVHRVRPRWQNGDLLWVREGVWLPPLVTEKMFREGADTWPDWYYDADIGGADREHLKELGWKYLPSIFMPRKRCRLWLRIQEVFPQRIQDVTADDAEAEGAVWWAKTTGKSLNLQNKPLTMHQIAFAHLWDTINKKRGFGWDTNVWVWACKFKKEKSL